MFGFYWINKEKKRKNVFLRVMDVVMCTSLLVSNLRLSWLALTALTCLQAQDTVSAPE